MEVIQLLISSLPESALGLLGALAVYLVITAKRNSTKAERDEQISLFEYRLSQNGTTDKDLD
jgi:hypothetical protein